MNKLDRAGVLIRQDAEYQKMLKECAQLEKQLFRALESVPAETNDIVWDYIMLCDRMSARKLWLACTDGKDEAE